jgi:von Willebrand factor type D domain
MYLFFSTCLNGKWDCPNVSCKVSGTVGGDPHYKTFENRYYDFMGRDKYYLLRNSNLSIETKNFGCNNPSVRLF